MELPLWEKWPIDSSPQDLTYERFVSIG